MNPTDNPQISKFVVGDIGTNMYLISQDGLGVVIDPGFVPAEWAAVVKKIRKFCSEIPAILLTHCHYDHISGCAVIQEHFLSRVYCHQEEIVKLHDPDKSGARIFPNGKNPTVNNIEYLRGGETIRFKDLVFQVMHTPGHSSGGLSFLFSNHHLFSGDTVFKGGIGRTDFYDGSYPEEMRSIKEKILALPPDTIIYPGHGPATSVREEIIHFQD